MARWLALAALSHILVAAPAPAVSITGQYVEARNCDVWTGPCFANAELNLTGRHAVLGWKVDRGTFEGARLDGLSVVAVVAASDTLGVTQTGPAKAVLIVDARADSSQRDALVRFAQQQGGALLNSIVDVQTAKISLTKCECKEGGCFRLDAGKARVETRCLDGHDKVCGNESAYYPPLAQNVKVMPAVATEHSFVGKGFNATWNDVDRRGAYVGTFEIK